LRTQTHFRLYRGRPIPFSCFPLPDMFLAGQWVSGPVFKFCVPGHVFGGTEGVGSRFHVLHALTYFRQNRGHRLSFSCFSFPDYFRRYRGCRVPFSCFASPDSFSAIPRSSGPAFHVCAPGHVFGGTEGVESRFDVLRSWTRFRRYRGRQFSF
jgi:hypothetical protein